MIKCVDKGMFTCIGRDGKPKKAYDTSDEVIRVAKFINDKVNNPLKKLVPYKCTHCLKFHLTTKTIIKKLTK